MGDSRFNKSTYTMNVRSMSYSDTGARKSIREEMSNRLDESLNPKGIQLRESRDSKSNPNSTPVIIVPDVTGSMGHIAHHMIDPGLGEFMTELIDKQIVADPHIMFAAVGDIECDNAPFQVSQFEADVRIVEQLRKVYPEGRGGGNDHESYTLPWFFADKYVETDAWSKRQSKGYIFTIGDEEPNQVLKLRDLQRVFGDTVRANEDIDSAALYTRVAEKWNVFHIVIEQGNYASSHLREVATSWKELIGNRTILLSDYKKLAEVMAALMRIEQGADPQNIINESSDKKVMERALFGIRNY